MEFARFGQHYVLRLSPGEEVLAVVRDFVQREDIRGAFLLAFGAFSHVRLRFFDVSQNRYVDTDVDRQVEVVSLLGNVAWKDGEPAIHIHVAVSDTSGRTSSGHLGEGHVRPTLEVFLTSLQGEVRRMRDPTTGLDLLALPERMPIT